MDPATSPLLTDLYQLNMMQAYLANGMTGTASFELFVRRLPPGRSFLMAAGLEQAVDWLLDGRWIAQTRGAQLMQREFADPGEHTLTALAAELNMSMAEVYEVATFYHHFDVVKEGETPIPSLTVRVCDSLSCAMAGAAIGSIIPGIGTLIGGLIGGAAGGGGGRLREPKVRPVCPLRHRLRRRHLPLAGEDESQPRSRALPSTPSSAKSTIAKTMPITTSHANRRGKIPGLIFCVDCLTRS